MAKRSANFYLIKTVRISGWVLFFIVILFICTGYGQQGKYGLNLVISAQAAQTIHKSFDLPLIVFFLTHSLTAIYLACRRWGWIKRRTRTQIP